MKRYFLIFAFCLGMGGLTDCNFTDDDTDELKDQKISFRLDGRAIEIESGGASFLDFTQSGGNGYNLIISGGQSTVSGTQGDGLSINMSFADELPTTKTYPQTTTAGDNILIGYIVTLSPGVGATYTSSSGEVTLTRFDLEENKISGNFSAILEKSIEFPTTADNQPTEIEITEGKFENLTIQN